MLNLDKNKLYLLACSFGPDSMALFDMLLKEEYNFMVAHVNYGVRNEAKEETKNLIEYCKIHSIKHAVLFAEPFKQKSNFEAQAREVRYRYFKDIYDKNHIDNLLIAHNEDDDLETYYLQRKRKSMVEHFGLNFQTHIFGMEVIRPILSYSKADLLSYCKENNVPYAIDSSNLTNDFERNIIRHTIVEKMNERERKNLKKEIDLLNVKNKEIYERINSLDIHNIKVLLSLDEDELQRAIFLLGRKEKKDFAISSSTVKEIKKILLSKKPNVSLKIDGGFFFVKEYETVSFQFIQKPTEYSYKIIDPSFLDTPFFKLDFSEGALNRNVKPESYPIIIRNAKKDDEIMINSYKVFIRRLFIDWKMPLSLRKKWPVIEDTNGKVIYVPRYRKDYKVKETDNFVVKVK